MNDFQLADFIEQSIRQCQVNCTPNRLNKPVLSVIFTGQGHLDYLQCAAQLQSLQAGYHFSFGVSHSAKADFANHTALFQHYFPNAKINEAITDCDLLFLPELSFNSLAKIALGIADNPASSATQQALFAQKNVIVTLDYFAHLPKGYDALGQQYLRAIIAQGITKCSLLTVGRDLSSTYQIRHFDQAIVQWEDVRHLPHHQPISISPHSLITPSAMDWIKQHSIRLIR